MRSKTSYFNPTLFKKNLARFWPLWGGVSLLGSLFPLYYLMMLVEEGFRAHAGQGLEITQVYYMALVYIVPAVSLVYAALCALAVWGWLYNARSVGLYHSLPITRKGLFATSFLSGTAMMLIPYAVTGGICVLVSLAAGLFEPVGLLVTILGVLGDTFFYFAAATLVVFVTGNPFAFAAFYFVFHFLAAFAEWLVCYLMSMFYLGVEEFYEGVLSFLSPTVYLTTRLSISCEYVETATPDGWIDYGEIASVTLRHGWLIAVYALAGAVLLACAWALYRRRRSESAGDVVAVGWMKPIFRYGVALCAAVSGGTLLYALFCTDLFQRGQCANPVPMAVCMALAGVVGYYIASMLLAKSLKVFRGSLKGVLGTAAAAAAVCCLIAADPFGVETWVPSAEELESVSIRLNGPYGRGVSSTLEDPGGMLKVLDAAILVSERADDLDRRWGRDEPFVTFYLYYRLKDGRYPCRYYNIPAAAVPGITQMLARLASDPVIQEDNVFGLVTGRRDLEEARLTGGFIGNLYSPDWEPLEDVDLTPEQARAVEAAVRRDIQAGHVGRTIFAATQEEYDQSAYFGDLLLNYTISVRKDGGPSDRPANYSETVSLGLSVYCTETLKTLEELGVTGPDRRLMTYAEEDARRERQKDVSAPVYGGYYDPYGEYYDEDFFPADVVHPESAMVYAEGAY